MAWQRGSKKEIGEGWKWMRKQNPDAATEAERWAEEHKEDMKEVDRILYRSDESYYSKTASTELEDAESMDAEGDYHDPDAFLPEDVRDRIYDDHTYEKNPYLPKDSGVEGDLYLTKDIAAGLHRLTDLQREVIFRNVIGGEDVSEIAEEKACSARNIRDIRTRALKALRVAATKGKPGDGYIETVIYVLCGIVVIAAIALLFVPDEVNPWERTAIFVGACVSTVGVLCRQIWLRRLSTKSTLRRLFRKNNK